jgi:DNA-binding CsgD family transcriptional regulator
LFNAQVKLTYSCAAFQVLLRTVRKLLLLNSEVSGRLSISDQSVKNTLRNVLDKLGVSDHLELALDAIHHR